MKTIVTWLWQGEREYTAAHVNSLARACALTLQEPLRFICIADRADGLAAPVEWMPTPAAAQAIAHLKNPEGGRFPSCFRRLWMFSEAARCLGERVLLVDIDTIPLKNFGHLWDAPGTFVGSRPRMAWGRADRVAGGLYLLTPGSHPEIWERFNGAGSIAAMRAAGFRGSDQAWISYCVGRTCAVWQEPCGVYSIRDFNNGQAPLPKDAALILFNGPMRHKPWNSPLPWVRAAWPV